jgi:hypothetical protein
LDRIENPAALRIPAAKIEQLVSDRVHRWLLEGWQPRDLTPEKLLEHSRLPLAWHDQRIVLGFG